MPKIIGLHGVRSNGSNSVDKLLSAVNHLDNEIQIVTNMEYSINVFETYHKKTIAKIVDQVLEIFEPGDHIVAHSAGALITWHLLQRLQITKQKAGDIFFYNAALNTNIIFPPNTFRTIYNQCEPGDWVLFFAQLLPYNRMGQMGRVGYKNESTQPILDFYRDSDLDELDMNHGDYFKRTPLIREANRILTTITNVII